MLAKPFLGVAASCPLKKPRKSEIYGGNNLFREVFLRQDVGAATMNRPQAGGPAISSHGASRLEWDMPALADG